MIGLAAAIWLAGCSIDPDYDHTAYTCPDQRCPDGFTCIDRECHASGVDAPMSLDDASSDDATPAADAPIDAPACACSPGPFANTCTGIEMLPGDGNPVCATTADNSNDLFGCTGAPMPGNDAVFRVSASAGQTITAILRNNGFDGAVYILSDCAGQCLTIADDAGNSGTETASHVAATTGDYFVAIDSPTGAGCYELAVTVQ